jgi:tRNA A37 threonylcarbamoyladenosine dehydratase
MFRFLDLRKQNKIQWLQDPDQSNVDNLNNARCEASRHFMNKKKEYLNAKIKQLETNSKIKNIRDMYRTSLTLRRATSLQLIQ